MASIGTYTTKRYGQLYRVRYNTPDGRRTDRRGFTDKTSAQAFADIVQQREPRQRNHRAAVIDALKSYQQIK